MIRTIIKNIIKILDQYLIYDNIQTNLKCYPVQTRLLLNQIISTIKIINFKKMFTLQNYLKCMIVFIDFLINILTAIIEFLNYIVFYVEYIIDHYYYGLTCDQLAYKCLLSVDYFDKALKYFMKKNYKGKGLPSPFTFFLGFFPSALFTFPVFYAILKFLLFYVHTLEILADHEVTFTYMV